MTLILTVTSPEASPDVRRRCEPMTVGVPFPAGFCAHPRVLVLLDESGRVVPLQVNVLDRWPDGSMRWALLDFQTREATTQYEVCSCLPPAPFPSVAIQLSGTADGLIVDTGVARFLMHTSAFPFASAVVRGAEVIDANRSALRAHVPDGAECEVRLSEVRVEEPGPLRSVVILQGAIVRGRSHLLDLTTRLHFFAGSAAVRVALTVRNPRRARHRGGFWELGDRGAAYLKDLALHIALPRPADSALHCSAEFGAPFLACDLPFELYQDSSGGENWRSPNHVNRDGIVPFRFRGYVARSGHRKWTGLRSHPAVTLVGGNRRQISLAVEHFWQNFPKAIEASPDCLTLRFFPRQFANVHEIQGGEQKTHTFVVGFGDDEMCEDVRFWGRVPSISRAAPSWYCDTGAVPYLTPSDEDPNVDCLRLVNAAIEGGDTFELKREVIDEYGWRNFGDIYADHEAVFSRGRTPVVSHYNNQYDAIAGFAYQFVRSGDLQWWSLMNELAAHVVDIDIYHTTRDKSAYNHGLFWHTYHYIDAGRSSHRAHPRDDISQGGGPSNEHNYTTGLMLHYFLTGNPLSREAAVDLARWVVDMDDGTKTMFRWLASGDTGFASHTWSPTYHGPGRGAGHSIRALLDGHRLTGDLTFLAKVERLIRRCIHPADDVPQRNLLDAERRWSYTAFLQALGRYLDYKEEAGELDAMYAYGRESLLHYARWMVANEYPYLQKPEILEYPTETWAAQDMRKSEVFAFAAKHSTGEQRERFLERSEFFFRYSVSTLSGTPRRTLARPVVLMLSTGFMRAHVQKHPAITAAPPRTTTYDIGPPERFVPQKTVAKTRLRLLALVGGLGALILLGVL